MGEIVIKVDEKKREVQEILNTMDTRLDPIINQRDLTAVDLNTRDKQVAAMNILIKRMAQMATMIKRIGHGPVEEWLKRR